MCKGWLTREARCRRRRQPRKTVPFRGWSEAGGVASPDHEVAPQVNVAPVGRPTTNIVKASITINMDNIRYIALDADDTLWMNETIFVNTQAACHNIIAPYMDDPAGMDAKLYEYERKNLRLFGYGIKGFMLSMIETAIELSGGRVSGHDIQRIIDLGKEMLEHPVHLLDTVEDTVKTLADNFFLMVITKGDLFDQENKLARSGIADHFRAVEIVSEKNEATYRDILRRHSIPPDQFLMVGNSVKSDVLPVLQAGGHAIHIPYHFTWELEKVGKHETQGYTYTELGRLGELLPLLLPG